MKHAAKKMIEAVSCYADHVALVTVATKKDELLDIEEGEDRKALRNRG